MKRSDKIMAVMTKPVNLAFVVSEEKAEKFLKSKADPKVKAKILKQAKKMSEHTTFSK